MLHSRLNLGSCRSALRPIMAVGWNARLEKYDSGYQYLQGAADTNSFFPSVKAGF